MTTKIAIATAEPDMFETLRRLLLGAGLAVEDVHDEPLQSPDRTRDWIAANESGLLVLDDGLPIDPRARRDRTTLGARSVFQAVQARGEPRMPVLLIVPTLAA